MSNNISRESEINKEMARRSAKVFLLQGENMLNVASSNGADFFAYYVSPCAVNLSFACELYLKILIANKNNGIVKAGHGLADLWKQLDPDYQTKTEEFYKKEKTIQTIDQCLDTHNQSFKEWRYYYEKGKSISFEPWSLYRLALSLYNVCEEVI